ncbi:MAG: hypothetical protein ACJAQ6_000498 [Arenicella sp.]|jgi:hypothetical protein
MNKPHQSLTETNHQPLSSKGVAYWADAPNSVTYLEAATESHSPASFFDQHYADMSGIVWVRLGSDGSIADLNLFVAALEQLRQPIILLTTDGDCSVPSSLEQETVDAIVSHPMVILWFTQNFDGTGSSKLRHFPIGLDLHTVRDPDLETPSKLLAQLAQTRRNAKPNSVRSRLIGCDLHLNINSVARYNAMEILHDCAHIEFLEKRISQSGIWRFYSHFSLVLSTHGGGLDCHRTWEQLQLGCIVVTKTSALDPLYEGLPVVIVESWDECKDPKNIDKWITALSPLTEANHINSRLSCANWIAALNKELT